PPGRRTVSPVDIDIHQADLNEQVRQLKSFLRPLLRKLVQFLPGRFRIVAGQVESGADVDSEVRGRQAVATLPRFPEQVLIRAAHLRKLSTKDQADQQGAMQDVEFPQRSRTLGAEDFFGLLI